MLEKIALAFIIVISFLVPLIILGILVWKNKGQRKRILLLFFSGILLYGAMQWGIKEYGLTWLFNNTDLLEFMNNHYILYLLMVAIMGSVLAVIPLTGFIVVLRKKKIGYIGGMVLGLGYGTAESILLIGMQSLITLVEVIKNRDADITMGSIELFLSGYERVLMTVVEIMLVIVILYFVQQKMTGKGCVIAMIAHSLITFLPGFFLAFTLKDYYEIYDRTVALILVYVVLTASAITSIVVLNSLKYQLNE